MRGSSYLVAFASTVLMLGLMSGPADAAPIKISGTHSKGEIKTKCSAAGGTFREGGKNFAYMCDNTGNGGGVVWCQKNGKCVGQGPMSIAAPTNQGLDTFLAGAPDQR